MNDFINAFPEVKTDEWISHREKSWSAVVDQEEKELRKKQLKSLKSYYFLAEIDDDLPLIENMFDLANCFPIQTKKGLDYFYQEMLVCENEDDARDVVDAELRQTFISSSNWGRTESEFLSHAEYFWGKEYRPEPKDLLVGGVDYSYSIDSSFAIQHMAYAFVWVFRCKSYAGSFASYMVKMYPYFLSVQKYIESLDDEATKLINILFKTMKKYLNEVEKYEYFNHETYVFLKEFVCDLESEDSPISDFLVDSWKNVKL
ncbi:hypothetical protein [Reinekea marinisedimentorum]|uniref:Uncharacterized protein n=1 Tax=Reinekea marinisedimentorum TaxID=230495 RepID=A0A4R3I4Y7_9GAMM|nr:hypothetical protein [Reinekea marinisedimentorum]TCS39049.1 hypothetical protein BCF53_11396 [Reinekea marinisedimentorum]